MDGLAHLRREVPFHALMLGVMAVAMASPSAVASLAATALLVVVSVPCAALSRRRTYLRAHVLDLWAMALVLLAALPPGSAAGGHHGAMVVPGWMMGAVIGAWLVARVALAAGYPRGWRVAAASGGITGAGLVLMVLICGA